MIVAREEKEQSVMLFYFNGLQSCCISVNIIRVAIAYTDFTFASGLSQYHGVRFTQGNIYIEDFLSADKGFIGWPQ
ncbi:hypothetical protein SLIQ_05135 [Serratia liquefaciens FK01]|nr:hypothetical protein SLIQ_05135 [Serratia liquefaciens FK01]